ncbi:MAG TPA: choline kinase family protein [Steroidobacteraceae bacterium]|nr:choline kinase family protein [Steroidobacteraceae bacterium]
MPLSDLERIALRHIPGSGAVSIERLAAGLVNESYRVRRDGRLYTLRIAAANAAELGVDRAWECRVLESAARAGLAPPVEHCEPSSGIVVSRWVEGRAWTLEETRQPEQLETIARLARRIHALPAPRGARSRSPAEWIAHYEGALGRSGAGSRYSRGPSRSRELASSLASHLAALDTSPAAAMVLCHSDLHRQNLVVGAGELILLDWEYAHLSEPFWDLAGWACNNDLGIESRRLLLERYLGRPPTAEDSQRLDELGWLYDYVCLKWSELYLSLAGGASAGIAARAELLAARLEGR